MIEVTTDPAHKRVIVYMAGMLTVDEVKQFSAREQEAVRGRAWDRASSTCWS